MKKTVLAIAVIALTSSNVFAMEQCRHTYRMTMAEQAAPIQISQVAPDVWLVPYLS